MVQHCTWDTLRYHLSCILISSFWRPLIISGIQQVRDRPYLYSTKVCFQWSNDKWSAKMHLSFTQFLQIKSNHFYCHITTAQVPWWVKFLWACSRQCKKQQFTYGQYIFTDCTEDNVQNTHTYTQYTVYYKDILNYQLHIIHRMGASTLCTLSIHYVVYT